MALHATIQKREDVERKKLGVYGFKAGTGSYKGELLFSIEWQGETVIAHLHVGGIDYAASVSLIPELSTFRADSSLPESHKAFEVKLGAKAIKTLFYDRRGQSTMYKAAADSICLAIHSKWLSGNR